MRNPSASLEPSCQEQKSQDRFSIAHPRDLYAPFLRGTIRDTQINLIGYLIHNTSTHSNSTFTSSRFWTGEALFRQTEAIYIY